MVRPLLRGQLHAVAALVAIPAGVLLIAGATHAGARACAAIFVASIVMAFGVSAVYHRHAPGRAKAVLQRLDHSMIYVLIAGTYTAVCLLGMPARWGVPLVAAVWAGAIAGIVIKLFAFHRRRWKIFGYVLYPVLGWAAVAALPAIMDSYTFTQGALVLLGGVLYSVGFPIFLLHRPNPWPRVFGYHEIWHALTIAACICHFAVVATLVS